MKSWKQIQAQLATEFNLPLKTIQLTTDPYWQLIRQKLRNPQDWIYRLEGLGSYRMNGNRLFKLLAMLLIRLRQNRAGLFPLAPRDIEEHHQQIRMLWRLKQALSWRLLKRTDGLNRPAPKAQVEALIQQKANVSDKDV
ncbi:hypothetical protein CLV58_109142 [Spirosoma oryzae]|uniref:Uncharacterized protein n=1 Tax=Spirosoma oryzae TaxID=1469603 RepID=A0A2T0SYC9_9BACT|nr:hypothetical protein [Spirosoma oryzae]PRY38415.1 hypothetical protein CLV58_109142 [Spirosoma oryzae]